MTTKLNNNNIKTWFNVRPDIWICLFLVIFVFCVYWQVRHFSFVNFDDRQYVTGNHHVQAGLTFESIRWSFTAADASNWHPLTWLSHMLDYQIYGMNPGHHHMTNVLFHLLNTLLLFFIFKRISGSLWKSAFVTAMFAIHPLHVESVAWVAERKDVLSTFFFMLTLWSYAGYVEGSRLDRYLLLILFYILGLMAKPMLVTLPFVLLLLDYWPLKRFQLKSSDNKNLGVPKLFNFGLIWEKIPLFLLSFASSIVTYLIQKSSGALNSMAVIPLHVRISNALVSYAGYIGKILWPHNLAVLYPYPKSIALWKIAVAGILLTMISVFVFRLRRSKPYLAVGWLWYLGTLVPVIGIVQVGSQAMADRYTYVPLIGIFIMIAWGVDDFITKWRFRKIDLSIISAMTLGGFMIASWFQVGYWSDSVTLFEHAINVTDYNSIAELNLGEALAEQNKVDDAVEHYYQSLKIKPDQIAPHLNLGVTFRARGNLDLSMNHFLTALQLKPDCAAAHYELGETLERKGEISGAVKHYLEAIKISPGYAKVYNKLGVLLASQNKIDASISCFFKALQINPDYAGAHYNLGKIYFNHKDTEKAIFHYKKALQADPNMIQALYHLAWIRATHEDEKYRNGKKAVNLATILCDITQNIQPLALDALAAAYAATGRFDKAVSTAQKALQISLKEGPQELALDLKNRLSFYQKGHPCHQTSLEEGHR